MILQVCSLHFWETCCNMLLRRNRQGSLLGRQDLGFGWFTRYRGAWYQSHPMTLQNETNLGDHTLDVYQKPCKFPWESKGTSTKATEIWKCSVFFVRGFFLNNYREVVACDDGKFCKGTNCYWNCCWHPFWWCLIKSIDWMSTIYTSTWTILNQQICRYHS